MDVKRRKAEGESLRGFLTSPLWTHVIEPELTRRKAEALLSANLHVESQALMAKHIGAHGELVDLQRWMELKAIDADLDLENPPESGLDLTQQ